jgi:IS30 family transposase
MNENVRRWADRDTMLKRDAEVARLRELDVPFREIGRRLGMSLGSVQKALRRYRKREAELAAKLESADDAEELDGPFAKLTAEEQVRVELAGVLADLRDDPGNELAKFRLSHIPTSTPGHPWGT